MLIIISFFAFFYSVRMLLPLDRQATSTNDFVKTERVKKARRRIP
jgi:hypothetical protein